jgi:hypothetical protein
MNIKFKVKQFVWTLSKDNAMDPTQKSASLNRTDRSISYYTITGPLMITSVHVNINENIEYKFNNGATANEDCIFSDLGEISKFIADKKSKNAPKVMN